MEKRILIIEDEPAIQKILSEPLAAAGYRVTAASDGMEGIRTFGTGKFDLGRTVRMPSIPSDAAVTRYPAAARGSDRIF